ncbi:hypothetical protein [Synechococcus sp. PROS-U-1]|uniref:hypothetical protein n=1 Tax=Synechococcus sp. PROS-U-1 TaxID=1400866 RepID=UPI0016467BE1|nr:hypothetical protein [Synechococcus sp. PROS-U-1]QNJ03728.1 hypothetical protein SynPROSU1_02132 [Synechococcus sp. PROS-U-1]
MTTASLKRQQMDALQQILPPSAEVASMLKCWAGADVRYWNSNLQPCWLTSNIAKYGKCIGTWTPDTRTLNLVPNLWFHYVDLGHTDKDGNPIKTKVRRPADDPLHIVSAVVIHEMCHQAQSQFYRDLDAAKGPRGRWFDSSHRCPSWSRACEDVIQVDEMDLFVPVWHRSTGNIWNPWVPDSSDWMKWKQVEPDDTFDGRKLASFDQARAFHPKVDTSIQQLCEEAGIPIEDDKGKPIEWTL